MKYKYKLAIIYTVVLFLDRLDLTIVNIALPTVAKYFGISALATDWINMSFLLALSLSIPISSWLGNRFGLKIIYIVSIILFGLSSSACGLVDSFYGLIFLRFLQGIGGGLLIPVGTTILYSVYDKSDYADITSLTFIPTLIAPTMAPFFGGILLDYFGWRFVFAFSGPICLIAALFALVILKKDSHKESISFDWGGFLLSSSLLIDIFYTLSLISKQGSTLSIATGILIFFVLLISFIIWETNHDHPLIDLNLFNNSVFVKANLIQLCFQACHFGAIFLVGLYLQVGLGLSATTSGFIMGMQGLGAMATSRYSVKLLNQYGPTFPISVGLAGIAIVSPGIMLIPLFKGVTFSILLFFIRGIFSGLCGTPIQVLSIITFSKEQISQVNSVFNACRQIAISLGIAIYSILIAIGLKRNDLVAIKNIQQYQVMDVFMLGFLSIPLLSIMGLLIANHIESLSTPPDK